MTRLAFLRISAGLLGVLVTAGLAPVHLSAQRMKLLTPETGWVLYHNTLYWTSSGGQSWSDITPLPPDTVRFGVRIHSVFFLNAQEGWAVISYPEKVVPATPESIISPTVIYDVAQTLNSGADWSFTPLTYTPLPQGEQEAISGPGDIFFLNEYDGWMVMALTGSTNFPPARLLATNDGGHSWSWVNSPGTVGTPLFTSTQDGWLAGGPGGQHLYVTRDGCKTWHEVYFTVPQQVRSFEYYALQGPPHFTGGRLGFVAVLYAGHEGHTSNLVVYSTSDGGARWSPLKILADSWAGGSLPMALVDSALIVPSGSSIDTVRAATAHLSGSLASHVNISGKGVFALTFADTENGLALTDDGRVLHTSDGGGTWTGVTPWRLPPNGKVIPIRPSVSPAGVTSSGPSNSLQPMASSRGGVGGNSHISVHLGFDMCQAPTVDKLATWWSYSPYYDFGVYIGGVNMACLNANVNSSWVSTVKGQGWGLMPLWVGYQAPCSTITSVTFDTSTAATLAQQDAEDASINASDDGLSNTIIYFDLEAYTAGGTCGAAVADFISDWVADIHSYGYLAGVYFSASDAQDVLNASLQPDDIWIGHYDNRATIFDTSYIGDSLFSNDQRIRQYLNYPNFGDGESYGGVAFDCSSSNCIDRDIEDAPVAGGNATKSYSSWTVQMFDYSSYNPPPGDTVLYGIDDDFMGQPNSTGSPGDMTGIEAPNSGNATNEGFFWCCTSGNFTLLNGFFSGAETKPFGLNNMDVVAGYYYPPTQVQGFLFNWVSSTAMTIDAPSAYGTFPRGINDNGDVVGSWADSSGSTHGFIAVSPYGESNWTSLDYSRGGTTYFVGVNGQGEVSGYYVDSKNASHGFVYSQSHGWTHIDICSGAGGTAVLGINNNGQVVGYCPNETAPSAFLYDIAHGSWIPITTPPGPYCTPGQTWGVNDSNMADGLVLNCEGNDLSDGFYSTPNP